MSKNRMIAAIAAALVVGLVAGNVVTGYAAPAPAAGTASAEQTAGPLAGLGLRMGAVVRDAGGRMVDVLAKLTGKSVDDVIVERKAGKSIAQIAEANGVDPDKVVADTLAVRKQLLDQAVADGTITQAQADAALARMTTRLSERVDSTQTGRMGGGRGRGAGAGCGMKGAATGAGGACGGACTGAPAATQ